MTCYNRIGWKLIRMGEIWNSMSPSFLHTSMLACEYHQSDSSSSFIRNGHSRSPSVLCIWHLRCIRSLSQNVMAAVACWWSLVPPAFSSCPPSTARTTGRRSSSSTAPSEWIGWRRWWAEWWAASADTDTRGWSLLQQHNIKHNGKCVVRLSDGVRRLGYPHCEFETFPVLISNFGPDARPDATNKSYGWLQESNTGSLEKVWCLNHWATEAPWRVNANDGKCTTPLNSLHIYTM